jgi:integrase
MVAAGWSRPYVNHQINRVRRLFRWAVVHEMVPASVLHGLQAVDGLRCGRTDAPEPPPVKPAPEGRVYAIRDHVSRQVFAMVELQILSGMRPGEVTSMRTRDVDVTGDVWIYKPVKHKTQHHGHDRTIYFGPKAKAVLQPYLKADLDACIFSPADAEADRRAKLTAARKTPLSCGNKPGTNQSKRPKHKPGGRYSVGAYLLAIYRGCDKAFPAPDPLGKRPGETTKQWKARLAPEERQELAKWQADHHFHPNQLRHNAATRIRKDYRAEAAQTILGHRNLKVTEIYAERNMEEAKRIMAEAG